MSNQEKSLAQYNPKQLFNMKSVHKKFEAMLGSKAQGFITSVLQAVNNSDMLSEATTDSIYNAAMTAAVLDLPVNPNLGFAYIIPYKKGKNGPVVAQFQMGYKGYIQLCQRSGLFKTISATEVYEGQIVEDNPLTGIEFNFKVKQSNKVVGYASYFELLNGFQKVLYMSVEEIEAHAKEYSQAYRANSGPWKDNFDGMAKKTVLKLLLSKYAPMTVEMQKAAVADMAEVKDEGMRVEYMDNPDAPLQPEADQRQELDTQLPEGEVTYPQHDPEPIIINDQEVSREDVQSEITAKAKEVWGKSPKTFVPKIKEHIMNIDPDSDRMTQLDNDQLLELHDQIMSLELPEEA
nr:hypothetical protein 12 [Balneolaceae bacterium]